MLLLLACTIPGGASDPSAPSFSGGVDSTIDTTTDTVDTADTADTVDTADTADTVDTVDTACSSEWFLDADGDGVGAGSWGYACTAPVGTAAVDGDCDDTDSTVFPGAGEAADGMDTDCDGLGEYTGNLSFAAGSTAAMATLCTTADVVVGSVSISGYDGADLTALSCLQVISKDLSISNNTALTSLTGLDQLAEVGGTFTLGSVLGWTNPLLVDATGLGGLETIGGNFLLVDTEETLVGLGALREVGGTLQIGDTEYGAEGPDSLDGLDGLETVGGLQQSGSHQADFTGLSALTTITGDLLLRSSWIDSFEGLDSLDRIDGDVELDSVVNLGSFVGLGAVTSIGGGITLGSAHANLLSMEGFEALVEIGELRLGSMSSGSSGHPSCRETLVFTDLPFPALTTVHGDLDLRCMPDLESLDGLASLESVGEDLTLWELGLTSLGMSSLTSVAGDFWIGQTGEDRYGIGWTDRIDLADLAGLEALESVGGDLGIYGPDSFVGVDSLVSIGGNLDIASCGATDLTGLDALASVGGNVMISNSDVVVLTGLGALETVGGSVRLSELDGPTLSLAGLDSLTSLTSLGLDDVAGAVDLTGFPALTTLPGGLELTSCDNLTSLDGAEGLTELGALTITSNKTLVDVVALHGLSAVSGNVTIRGNVTLASADADALVAAIESIGGTVDVSGNGP